MAKRVWTATEEERLERLYPKTSGGTLAIVFKCTVEQIYRKANQLGLKKTEEYLASPLACRLRHGDEVGKKFRFEKGHVPANKGLRRPGWAPGRMAETQFKKGQRGNTYQEIGSERLSKDGYLQRKVSATGYPPKDWRGVHIILWEETNGPLPEGHVICFKDGDKKNITIENLEMISRAERMRRNTIHRYPPELKQTIRLVGKLKRKIKAEENEKQG